MTAIMCSPVLYVCDGCQHEAMGTTVRLPKGWREDLRHRAPRTPEHGSPYFAPVEYLGHLCISCRPPEEKNG